MGVASSLVRFTAAKVRLFWRPCKRFSLCITMLRNQKPVIRCSICTGEQVAGFKNIHTGKFEEVMLIRNESDRRTFMEMYDIDTVSKEY